MTSADYYGGLCIVCGIPQNIVGKRMRFRLGSIITDEETQDFVQNLASSILDTSEKIPNQRDDVVEKLGEALMLFPAASYLRSTHPPVLIEEFQSLPGGRNNSVGIGAWDDLGRMAFKFKNYGPPHRSMVFPGSPCASHHVVSRSLGHDRTYGGVRSLNDNAPQTRFLTVTCDGNGPSFVLCECCFRYLHSWIDWGSLPPRSTAFPNDSQPKPFHQELYEIVNSRTRLINERNGSFPCIDYGSMDTKAIPWFQQYGPQPTDYKHIRKALVDDLDSRELLLALLKDFNSWMLMRPDIWPDPPEPSIADFQPPTASPQPPPTALTNPAIFTILPLEIWLHIFETLPAPSILAFSATCRALHTTLTKNTTFANLIFRTCILHGELYWILPVPSMVHEVERAYTTARKWLPTQLPLPLPTQAMTMADSSSPSPKGNPDESDVDSQSPFVRKDFPAYAFVKACFASDFMRSRERIWRITTEQFQEIWVRYRTEGWEMDRFVSAEVWRRLCEDGV